MKLEFNRISFDWSLRALIILHDPINQRMCNHCTAINEQYVLIVTARHCCERNLKRKNYTVWMCLVGKNVVCTVQYLLISYLRIFRNQMIIKS